MGKFDERTLRMRKERIDLFGDKKLAVIISRPERPARSVPKNVVDQIEHNIATANPSVLCFDPACKTEVHKLNTFAVVFRNDDSNAPPITMTACETCSKKSNEEILSIMRPDLAGVFSIGPDRPMSPEKGYGTSFDEENVSVATVAGIQLAIVGAKECGPALAFHALLEARKLPRFAFAFRGFNNCFGIVHQLFIDFEALGVADIFACREGFSGIVQPNGKPIGTHRWVEAEGWVIDASGGADGNPILFQQADDYYRKRQMTDVRTVAPDADSTTP